MTTLPPSTSGPIQRVDVTMPYNVPSWRPWQALTQAEYNQISANNAWDPNVLYVVTPQRVFLGGKEVWPGPFEGGIVSVSNGFGAQANPVQDIPLTTAGSLVVAFTSNRPTGVTDSAGQTWQQAITPASGAPDCWYIENSAPISDVQFTGPGHANGAWRVFEVAGVATEDSLDTVLQTVPGTGLITTVNADARALAFAVIYDWGQVVVPTGRPSAPWQDHGDLVHTAGINTYNMLAATRLMEGGTTDNAVWTGTLGIDSVGIGITFRTVATDITPVTP